MNQTLFYSLYDISVRHPALHRWVIFFAEWFPYFVALFALIFIWLHREEILNPLTRIYNKFKELLYVFGSALAALIISKILKYLINWSRPFDAFTNVTALIEESGHTFPSGHASFFGALAVAIFYINKKAGFLFMFFALLIGVARVMAGVHFPLDILGGYILGALVAILLKNI